MKPCLCLSGPMWACFVISAGAGQNQPYAKGKVVAASAEEYAQVKQLKVMVGKLARVDTSSSGSKVFTIAIPFAYSKSGNPGRDQSALQQAAGRVAGLQNQLFGLQGQLMQAMSNGNPRQQQQAVNRINGRVRQMQGQLAAAQRQLNQQMTQLARNTATGFKEFDMEAVDQVVVRRLRPHFEYDDKGYPKKYSKEDLEKMRGKDKSLPGLEASIEDLEPGQPLQLRLVTTPSSPKNGSGSDSGTEKKSRQSTSGRDLPRVNMIVILADSDDADFGSKAPAAKQKKK